MNTVIQIINNDKYLAIRWPHLRLRLDDDEQINDDVKAICVIHANGNLTIYYEKIPGEIEKKLQDMKTKSWEDNTDYSTHPDRNDITVIVNHINVIEIPSSIARSGVLIECAVIPLYPTRRSCDTCDQKYVLDRKCRWCSVLDHCVHRFDLEPTRWIAYEVSNNTSTDGNKGKNLTSTTEPIVHSSETPIDESTPVIDMTTEQTTQQSVYPENVTKVLEIVTVIQTPNQFTELASSRSVPSVNITTEHTTQQSVNSKNTTVIQTPNQSTELASSGSVPSVNIITEHTTQQSA
ncbi:hypothetical protein MN116_000280 [Schistosoma mekongi]|uniref:Uncharacterized protein n=1 Tax=Schistosoma mekongi TaxID=38744 RepID=A0AAE1Z5X7_SCHME|nr:hypothetical protein MN116_000280 [Schistosoma mekongi]